MIGCIFIGYFVVCVSSKGAGKGERQTREGLRGKTYGGYLALQVSAGHHDARGLPGLIQECKI